MKSIALQAKSISELKDKIKQAVSSDFKPTLAVTFASVAHNLEELSELLAGEGMAVFGASSSGEIAENEVFEQSIVVMLLDMNKDSFALYSEKTKGNNTAGISKNAAQFAQQKFQNPAILILSAGLTVDGVSIVEGVNNEIKTNIPLYGGLAGDDFKMQATYVFTNKEMINDGLVFLIIDHDKIEVNGLATSGWETIGVEKTVTKAEGNIVYEIDHKPALDLFLNYYGIKERDAPLGMSVGTKYPLQFVQENKAPVLRTPFIANKEDNSIMFAGRIPEGSKVRFSIQPSFEIIDKTIEEMKFVHTQNQEADALLMFSCAGRHVAFGPMMEDEVEGIKEIWDAPLVGLFTYGEIGNAKNEASDFHNETCSLVLLKERIK